MALRLHNLHAERLVLLQSSFSQSSIPIFRRLVSDSANGSHQTLLICFLYRPSSLLDAVEGDKVLVHDFREAIPDYHEESKNLQERIYSLVKDETTSSPIDIFIDSVDVLIEDFGSSQAVYTFLRSLLSSLSKSSRLILHACSPSLLIPLITSASFSPALSQVIARPPELLVELAKEYMTYPPPLSPEAKFWNVYIPLSEREHEITPLVLQGRGGGNPEEFVVEIISRGGSDASGRRKSVERTLEAWDTEKDTPIELGKLKSLSELFKRKVIEEAAPDPTQNISFNLHLTSSQQEARAKVPLPYVLEDQGPPQTTGAILYDPDSADDIDDDDPDEDLDI